MGGAPPGSPFPARAAARHPAGHARRGSGRAPADPAAAGVLRGTGALPGPGGDAADRGRGHGLPDRLRALPGGGDLPTPDLGLRPGQRAGRGRRADGPGRHREQRPDPGRPDADRVLDVGDDGPAAAGLRQRPAAAGGQPGGGRGTAAHRPGAARRGGAQHGRDRRAGGLRPVRDRQPARPGPGSPGRDPGHQPGHPGRDAPDAVRATPGRHPGRPGRGGGDRCRGRIGRARRTGQPSSRPQDARRRPAGPGSAHHPGRARRGPRRPAGRRAAGGRSGQRGPVRLPHHPGGADQRGQARRHPGLPGPAGLPRTGAEPGGAGRRRRGPGRGRGRGRPEHRARADRHARAGAPVRR